MAAMQKLDSLIHIRSRVIEIYVEFDGKAELRQFLAFAREEDFNVTDVQVSKNKLLDKTTFCAVQMLKSRVKRSHGEMTDILSGAPGVQHLEEL